MARIADGPWYRKDRDTWCVVIDGRRIALAKGKANRQEARRKFADLIAQRSASPSPDGGRPTVQAIIEAFLVHSRRHYSARSYDERKAILQRFNDAHGFRLVSDCKAYHLTRWLDDHPQWASDWTLNTVVSVVKRPFDWAVQQDLCPSNPFRGVNRRPGVPRRPVSVAEVRAMMRGAPGKRGKRFRLALAFLFRTGARPGEMANLRWADVDLENRRIVLLEHKTVKKVRRPRIIPLTPDIVRLLERVGRLYPSTDHVFLNERGNPWNRCSLSLRVQIARKRQGIDPGAKLYGVRHRFGTGAIVNGVDIKTLAQLMGHSSTRMTEHYVHLAGESEHLELAMRRATGRRPAP